MPFSHLGGAHQGGKHWGDSAKLIGKSISVLLLALDLVPVHEHLGAVSDLQRTKDMGMTVDELGANIVDISQTVMKEYFTMIMLVSIEGLTVKFSEFAQIMTKVGGECGVDIRVMHEDIFNTMHRI